MVKLTSKIRDKLIELFNFNKHNTKKNKQLIQIIADPQFIISVYKSLEKNKNFIVSKTNILEIKNLSNKLKKGKYFWQKTFLSVKNIIFTKLIKLILIIIYEPEFQILNYNFGFRPKKSAPKAINHLKIQILDTKMLVLKGQMEETDTNKINSLIMLKILRKKIDDSKFLALVKVILKNLKQLSNNAIYSILFNIYLHEFDLYISRKIKKVKLSNQEKNQKLIVQDKLYSNNVVYKIKAKQKILLTKTIKLDITKFQNVKNKLKKYKQKQMKSKINDNTFFTQIIYNRYCKD